MKKAAFGIYLVTLVLSILLFGGVHVYGYTLMTLGVLAGTVLVVLKGIHKNYRKGVYVVGFPGTEMGFFMLGMFLLLALQMLPMPPEIPGEISPAAVVVGNGGVPASQVVAQGAGGGKWFSLSPYVYPVRISMIRFLVYGLFFFGFIQVLDSRRRINVAVSVMLVTGCFVAMYGLMQTYSGAEHIWWFRKQAYRGDICGTYINRNHFAGLMGMCLLMAAAFAAALAPGIIKRRKEKERRRSIKERLSDILSREETFNRRLLVVFGGVVCGIGLIFSASRGGMIAVAGGMLLMGLLFVFRRRYRKNGIILLILFLLISGYAVKIGVEYPISRFMSFYSSLEERQRYAERTLNMFDEYPVSGVGVGNFKYAYPKYQAPQDRVFIRFAHNDWAQFLAEAGISGLFVLVAGVGYFIFRIFRTWTGRRDPYAVCLGILPLAVFADMGIHSYSDFNLHIPANFLVMVAVVAIGYAALHLERHHRREQLNYRCYELPLKYRGAFFLLLFFGLAIWSGGWSIRHFMAEAYCNTVPNSTLNRDLYPPREEIVKALWWDPSNADYWFKLWEVKDRAHNTKDDGQNADDGVKALERAVSLNPFEARYHVRLGWEYAHLWQEKDYHSKWLPAADVSMERAAYFAGEKNAHLHQELGNYWTMRSKTMMPDNPLYRAGWRKALFHYHKAQRLTGGRALKRMQKEIRNFVWNFYPDETFVAQALSNHK